jgi:hypothetical protein
MLALGGETGANLAPFVPLNTGNVVFVPEVAPGETISAERRLVVDGSADPKAYSLPVALDYDDVRGGHHADVQRLSLMVQRRPEIQASFYQDPGVLSTGAASEVSLEIVNTGTSVIDVLKIDALGEGLAVTAAGLPFLGPLDPGGAAPLDLTVTPSASEVQALLLLQLTYRDDFNQPQVITATLPIQLSDTPGGEGAVPDVHSPATEQQLGKTSDSTAMPLSLRATSTLWRVLRGLLGFGS